VHSASLQTFTIATNEYRAGNNERTEYHPCVAWDRLAEITGQFLSKGQLVDIEGRLQTRQWDDDAGKRHRKTEVLVASLEMLAGRTKVVGHPGPRPALREDMRRELRGASVHLRSAIRNRRSGWCPRSTAVRHRRLPAS
jgi:single stranded DNA-binding protein